MHARVLSHMVSTVPERVLYLVQFLHQAEQVAFEMPVAGSCAEATKPKS